MPAPLAALLERGAPLTMLAGRMSMNTTDSPLLTRLRKLPVIGTAPVALELLLDPAEAALEAPTLADPLTLAAGARLLLVPLEAVPPVPLKNAPVHWLWVMVC